MEFWYYIRKDGKTLRVTHEVYREYDGEKFYTLPYPGLRFLDMMINSCRKCDR